MGATKLRNFRSDANCDEAIDYLLAEPEAGSFSQIVRDCLVETARAHRRAALRQEALATRDDPVDRAQAKTMAREMAEINVW